MRKQVVLGALALLSASCVGNVPIKAPSVAVQPFPDLGPPSYELQIGDALGIKFWGYPELDEEVTIRPDGKISLPFIDEVQAAELTPAELDAELTRRYTGELASPQITVILRRALGQQVYVGGQVGGSGPIAMTPKLTLFQALQTAGLTLQARRRTILLIRTFSDGSRIARSVNIKPILSGRDPSADILLQPFDVVYVAPRKIEGFQTFVSEYLDPIYGLLPVRIVGTVRLFAEEESLFD